MPRLPVCMHFSFVESDCGFFSSCLQGSGMSLGAWESLGCPTIMVERNKVLGLPPPHCSFFLLLLKLSRLLGHHGLCHTQHCPTCPLEQPTQNSVGAAAAWTWVYQNEALTSASLFPDTNVITGPALLSPASPCLGRGLQSHPGLGRL